MRVHLVLVALAGSALGSAMSSSCGGSCGSTSPPTGTIPATTRVLLLPAPGDSSPLAVTRDKALGTKRLVFDERDAWVVPLGEDLVIDARLLPGASEDALVIDVALTGTTAHEPTPKTLVDFVLRRESDRGVEQRGASVSWESARERWSEVTPIRVQRGDAWERLVLSAKLQTGASSEGQGVSACFSLRSMPGSAASRRSSAAMVERPNILIVSVDTLRADHLGCYGYARSTSPHVDRLAQRGVLFEQALSAAPWTLPSYGSLFTGLMPAEHRAGIVTPRENAWGSAEDPTKRETEILRADVRTLAEILRADGYRTAGFSSNPFLDPRRGLGRGFERYVGYESNAANGVDFALDWLGASADAPWFLFLHLMDPHFPYAPPAPFDVQFAGVSVEDIADYPPSIARLRSETVSAAEKKQLVDLYDGAIAFADQEIGRLLATLEASGEAKNTIVVFHSDHGEEFWDHGGFEHGHSQYQELLRVPLILAYPARLPQAQRIAQRVRTVDVMPTLLELVSLECPAGLAGQSLLSSTTSDRDALAEGILHGRREIKAHLRGPWKSILAGASQAQLYDLVSDPGELSDLAAREPARAASARAELIERRRALTERVRQGARLRFDPASRSRVNGMGYTGTDDDEVTPAPVAPSSPAPR